MSFEPSQDDLDAIAANKLLDAPPVRKIDEPHRMLPHSPECEQGVLCSMLLSPNEVCALCHERKVTAEWFYAPARADIFRIAMKLWDEGISLDQISLTQAMRSASLLDRCGGVVAIYDLFTYLPTAANVEHYLDVLSDKWVLREQIKVATVHLNRCYEMGTEGWSNLDSYERDAFAIRAGVSKSRMETAREVVIKAVDDINYAYEHKGQITGIATGIAGFDKLTSGLQPSCVYVIGGRPGDGKSSLALNMAEHIAIVTRKPIAFYSLEMSNKQLVQRSIASNSRINAFKIMGGFLSGADFERIHKAASSIANSPMYFDDTSALTIEAWKASLRRMKAQHGIEVAFIDYLQLMRSTATRARENRQVEVSDISGGIKDAAKELGLPIVVLAQINRPEKDRNGTKINRRPRLEDLRESGAIEQDADVVGLLMHEAACAETEEERIEAGDKATLIVAKQRSGPTGDVALTFHKSITRFEDRVKEQPPEPQPDLL